MPDAIPQFADWIKDLDHGNTHAEITAALAALTADVVARRKAGKLVIEIQVAPADDQARNVYVAAKVTPKAPPKQPAGSIYFPDTGGGLHRNDPYAKSLFDRDLTGDDDTAPRDLSDTNTTGDTE